MATITPVAPTSSTANSTSYASNPFTPAAGEYLVVGIVAGATGGGADTLTSSAGLTFDLLRIDGAGGDHDAVFVSREKTTAVSQTVTYSCAGDAADGCVIHPWRVGAVNRLALRQAAGQGFAAGATPLIGQQFAAHADSLCFAVLLNASNPAGVAAPSGWTRDANSGYATPTTGAAFYSRNTGYTSAALTFGGTSATAGNAIIVELFVDKLGAELRGSAVEQTADTSIGVSPDRTIPAGAAVVVVGVFDNAGAGGTDPSSGLSDTDANTWVPLQSATRVGAGQNGGVTLRSWYARLGAAMATSDVVTLAFSANTTAKVLFLYEVEPGLTGRAVVPVGTATDATGTSATPSVTRTGVAINRLLLGVLGIEHDLTPTVDVVNDAQGPWVRARDTAAGGGSTTSTVRLQVQQKVTEAAGDTTYAPLLGGTSVDWAIAIVEFEEVVEAPAGSALVGVAGQAASVTTATTVDAGPGLVGVGAGAPVPEVAPTVLGALVGVVAGQIEAAVAPSTGPGLVGVGAADATADVTVVTQAPAGPGFVGVEGHDPGVVGAPAAQGAPVGVQGRDAAVEGLTGAQVALVGVQAGDATADTSAQVGAPAGPGLVAAAAGVPSVVVEVGAVPALVGAAAGDVAAAVDALAGAGLVGVEAHEASVVGAPVALPGFVGVSGRDVASTAETGAQGAQVGVTAGPGSAAGEGGPVAAAAGPGAVGALAGVPSPAVAPRAGPGLVGAAGQVVSGVIHVPAGLAAVVVDALDAQALAATLIEAGAAGIDVAAGDVADLVEARVVAALVEVAAWDPTVSISNALMLARFAAFLADLTGVTASVLDAVRLAGEVADAATSAGSTADPSIVGVVHDQARIDGEAVDP